MSIHTSTASPALLLKGWQEAANFALEKCKLIEVKEYQIMSMKNDNDLLQRQLFATLDREKCMKEEISDVLEDVQQATAKLALLLHHVVIPPSIDDKDTKYNLVSNATVSTRMMKRPLEPFECKQDAALDSSDLKFRISSIGKRLKCMHYWFTGEESEDTKFHVSERKAIMLTASCINVNDRNQDLREIDSNGGNSYNNSNNNNSCSSTVRSEEKVVKLSSAKSKTVRKK